MILEVPVRKPDPMRARREGADFQSSSGACGPHRFIIDIDARAARGSLNQQDRWTSRLRRRSGLRLPGRRSGRLWRKLANYLQELIIAASLTDLVFRSSVQFK
jgi:hypothetical protein